MRQNQQNKNRMRGRSRKGPNPLTRTFESNGPDVKIRGTALHLAEKYTQLARDASSSGDRVMAENYLQHAEHYYRVIAAAQAALQPQQGIGREDAEDADDDLEPIGSDRFEPRHIEMRPQPGNGGNPQEREGQPQPQHVRGERGDYDRGERRDRGERQPEGQERQGGERTDRDQRGRDRGDRRPRFDRNFDRRGDRGERGERGFDQRQPPAAAGGPQPMPLDAPQPDVNFPEPPVKPTPAPTAAAAAPAPQVETPVDAGGEEKPVRRRRAPRARKPDAGENAAPEPSAVE